MDARLQRRVQRYGWDRAADRYEEGWRQQLAPAHTLMLVSADLGRGEVVLDVACGTGLVALAAAHAVGAEGKVVATDISAEMVGRTERRARELGLAQIETARMEAESLEFDTGTFDAALCGLGLMYLPDPLESLREMHRVLRPDGRAAVAVWGRRDRCGWAEIFPIVDARVRTEVCPLFFQLGTGDALELAMTTAGFSNVVVERIGVDLRYGSTPEAIDAVFAGGPVAMAYSRFDDETRESAHAAYLASIAAYRRGPGYRIPGEFVIARGDRAGSGESDRGPIDRGECAGLAAGAL